MKPVVYEDFFVIFAKWPQKVCKGIRFSLKMSRAVCNNKKSNIENPYKTCRL